MQPDQDGFAHMMISTPSDQLRSKRQRYILLVKDQTYLQNIVLVPYKNAMPDLGVIMRIDVHEEEVLNRKKKLCKLIPDPKAFSPEEKESILTFLTDHHQAFCLDDNERWETDLLQV